MLHPFVHLYNFLLRLYACPGEQRTVRLWSLGRCSALGATTTSCDVHFVFADLRQGQLILKYNEHAMRARVAREKLDEDVNPIDHHSIILASTEAAVKILTDNPSTPFLLFLDEFMTSAGHKESPAFQSNMKLIWNFSWTSRSLHGWCLKPP